MIDSIIDTRGIKKPPHYSLKDQYGGYMQSIEQRQCAVKGCLLTHKISKGYCGRHYSQLYKYGRIIPVTSYDSRPAIIKGNIAKIPLGVGAKDGYAIVDVEDAWVDKYKWYKSQHGYAQSKSGQILHMHRLVMQAPDDMQVDHNYGNSLDNRKSQLRIATEGDNSLNQGRRNNNTTGYKGVIFRRDTKRFSAGIWCRNIHYSLGCYDTNEEAALAYDCAAIQLHGDYARLNLMDMASISEMRYNLTNMKGQL